MAIARPLFLASAFAALLVTGLTSYVPTIPAATTATLSDVGTFAIVDSPAANRTDSGGFQPACSTAVTPISVRGLPFGYLTGIDGCAGTFLMVSPLPFTMDALLFFVIIFDLAATVARRREEERRHPQT